MTVKEGRELVKQLRIEIENGIDVDFNTRWIELLNERILDAIERGYAKAMRNLKTNIN